jgi:hypothetical protein
MGEQGYVVNRNACVGRKHRLEKQGVVFEPHVPPPAKPRVRSVTSRPPKPIREVKPVKHDEGVDYLKNGPDGCKAILDKRGRDGLHMCCGRLRYYGRPYCEYHDSIYNNRKAD